MKKQITLLLLLTMLVGCGTSSSESNNESIDSSNVVSSTEQSESASSSQQSEDVPSSENPPSSQIPPSSETPPSSGSSETTSEGKTYSNLTEIRELGETLKSKANDRGVYTSNYYAEFTAQLLTIQAYGAGQNGYTSEHKIFAANSTGYITIAVDSTYYKTINNYHDKQQVYTFNGYIGVYNNEVEVVSSTKPVFKENVVLDYDYKTFAVDGPSLAQVSERSKKAALNSKGIYWESSIEKYTLKYLEKIENEVSLFTDGSNIIQVHSHEKLNNSFSVNTVYEIYARAGMFQFKPELEFIGVRKLTEELDFDYANVAKPLTATSLYTYKYDNDAKTNTENLKYSGLFIDVYYYEGYANYYTKGTNDFIVLEDTLRKTAFRTQENAYGAKAMFVNNDHSQKLDSNQDWLNTPFLDYVDYDSATNYKPKLGIYFAAYGYNTVGYWQIQVLTNPFEIL